MRVRRTLATTAGRRVSCARASFSIDNERLGLDVLEQRAIETAGFGPVRFERQHADWSVYDTMNVRSTHQPGQWRAGRGDILLALGRA